MLSEGVQPNSHGKHADLNKFSVIMNSLAKSNNAIKCWDVAAHMLWVAPVESQSGKLIPLI